jgi:hypothetical protein
LWYEQLPSHNPDRRLASGSYVAKLAFSVIAVALGWLLLPMSTAWAIAFLCATFPAIWSKRSSVRRRLRAAFSGIGVALIIYFCMVGIVAGLMTWSHEAAQNGALVLQLLMFVAAYWVSRQILKTRPYQASAQISD